jgi:hypothetical protein
MNLIERYADKISGVLSCFDRLIIQGTIQGWCYAGGMTTFLHVHQIRIFDFPQWANDRREELRQNAERLAAEHGLQIEFIRKNNGSRKFWSNAVWPQGWSIFSRPWKPATATSRGMTNRPVRRP